MMKKFIATLLSALVGVFGYTLTDSVVEDRISKLETEIVELREQISESNESNGPVEPLKVGDYIKISSTSLDKLLLRENESGELEFIHPYKIDQINEDDIFVYLTDVTCQVVDYKTITGNTEKGKNYEPDTISLKFPVISVNCNGYTSSSLSGKQITFSTGLGQKTNLTPIYRLENSKSTCFISSDGSFSFNAEYSAADIIPSIANLIESFYFTFGKENIESLFLAELSSVCFYGFSIYDVTIS